MCIRDRTRCAELLAAMVPRDVDAESDVQAAEPQCEPSVGPVSYTHLTLPTSDLV